MYLTPRFSLPASLLVPLLASLSWSDVLSIIPYYICNIYRMILTYIIIIIVFSSFVHAFYRKNDVLGVLGGPWGSLGGPWGPLGVPGGSLEVPRTSLGPPWDLLGGPRGSPGKPLGGPWASLGPLWDASGVARGVPGRPWGSPGTPKDAPRDPLKGLCWGHGRFQKH